ncbi:MAG: glycine cleavage system protein GcvH [Thermoprotei archaeon]|nr:glycine cleavage system protein GcvH [Thermoprotei archaeon]
MGVIEVALKNMNVKIDDTLLYTPTDEWVRVEGDTITIGISDYAQKMLRDIVGVELPKKGVKTSKGQAVVVIESIKATVEVYTPLAGTVVEVNERLKEEPELLNKDPYGEGWILKIKLESPGELEKLLKPQDYIAKLQTSK